MSNTMIECPLDDKGQLCSYQGDYNIKTWQSALSLMFIGELEYSYYTRGRSSALLVFKDAKGLEYQFFLSEVDTFIKKMKNGKIAGCFMPVKRGANFSWSMPETK